jgi:2-hydroxy-3-keto-5-methylthiopentenyl-1-phosphate phosphatase
LQPLPPRTRTLVLDYDGTITEEDLLDTIACEFGDPAVYHDAEDRLHAGEISLRECITREYETVTASLEDVVAWTLDNVRIRPGLCELVDLAHARDWHIVVVSSGFVELIDPVLDRERVNVQIVANSVDATTTGWRVIWREQATCAACGEECKRGALPVDGEIVYMGDGISDRCAALASDRIFATRGLARYLAGNGVSFERFDDFFDVARALA